VLSYGVHGTLQAGPGLKRYYSDLRRSFSDLRFEVHGEHRGAGRGRSGGAAHESSPEPTTPRHYAGVARETGNSIPGHPALAHLSASVRTDRRALARSSIPTPAILVAIGAIPQGGQRIPADSRRRRSRPGGLLPGGVWAPTFFSADPAGRAVSRGGIPSRGTTPLYDGVISTGRIEDVEHGRRRATSRTQVGRPTAATPSPAHLAISRSAMPDGRALQNTRPSPRNKPHRNRGACGTGSSPPAARRWTFTSLGLLPHRGTAHRRALGKPWTGSGFYQVLSDCCPTRSWDV